MKNNDFIKIGLVGFLRLIGFIISLPIGLILFIILFPFCLLLAIGGGGEDSMGYVFIGFAIPFILINKLLKSDRLWDDFSSEKGEY